MVHLCNIKMSADTIRHKSNSNYFIDDFINQLLSSQKFDELAEKVADKAVSKIRDIEASPPRLERFIDENKDPEAYNSNFQLRNDGPSVKDGKIDTHAVMDETTSQVENLKLKYKYLTRNAYEREVFNDRASDSDHNSLPRNDKNDDTSQNQDHDLKADGRDDVIDKNNHGSKNDYESGNRWRHELRDVDRKDSGSKRHSKHSNTRNDRDDGRNKNIKKKVHSRENLGSRHEQKRSREVQNSRPEFKSLVKGQVDKKSENENGTIGEENPSTVEERHTEISVSAEKTKESIQEEGGSEENVEQEAPPKFQFRAHADSLPDVDENKVTADINKEDQKVLDENPGTSSRKPIIRREGDKLFTFVESPEYAEYHQEMAKLIKDKEKSPADFLIL